MFDTSLNDSPSNNQSFLRRVLDFTRTKTPHTVLIIAVVASFAFIGTYMLVGSHAATPGVSIPDTDYAIPAGAIFVSPGGLDTNTGTQADPIKSLTKAYSMVPSGGTIVFRGGLYRDGTTTRISKPMTLQPYPHEQVWFDGMDVTTGWTASGNQWVLGWSTPSFCNGHYYDLGFRAQTNSGPCTYPDQYGDSSNPMSADPQMVYIDGSYVHEVATAAEAVGNNFYYDQAARRIVLGTNPSGHTVEVTARPTAIFIEGGSGNVTIRGLGFAHYATDNFPETAGFGAVIANSPRTTFENVVFTENAGAGIQFADPTNGVIRNSLFYRNGSLGVDANGHQNSGGATDNMLIEKSVFDGNNTERFGVGCDYSCQAAGVKMAHMVGVTIQDNIFKNGVGQAHGWWCDMACTNAKIVRNLFQNNGGAGIYYEISDTGIIASNLSIGNGAYGIKVGSANTKIYNNTIVNNGVGALIYDDDRAPNYNWGIDAGPSTVNLDMENNIFSMNRGNIVQSWRTSAATPPNTGPNTFYSGYDYNSYFRSGNTPYVSEWRDGTQQLYSTVAALTGGKGKEANGQDITSGTDPFFVNQAGGDYHVRQGSVAYNSGRALPVDVAAAVGVTSSPVSRGAIVWASAPPQAANDTTAPSVSLTAPTVSTKVAPSTSVVLAASAADNIAVSKVEFYSGSTLISTDTSAPYSASWTAPSAAGAYNLTAKAYDAAGNAQTSSAIGVTVAITAAVTGVTIPYHMNAGGAAFTDASGTVWSADAYGTDGTSGDAGTVDRGNIAIAGTTNAQLYRTEHYGMTGYNIPVANGTYKYRLHFAETYSGCTVAGCRIMNVSAENKPILTGLDVLKVSGGHDTALIREGTITVADNNASFSFTASAGNPEINGIELLEANTADTVAPVVTMTTPANTAQVSGEVNIAAAASDNIGVIGVTFKVNSFVIYDDLTAPYNAVLSTAPVADGSYTLSAIARDAAGNQTTASIVVNVKNTVVTTATSTNPCVGTAAPVQWKHVVVVMFENKSYSSVIGSAAPWITNMAQKCGTYANWKDANYKVNGTYEANYYSKPNYATLTSGLSPSAHGLRDDSYSTTTTADNIYNRLNLAGKSAKDYYSGTASTTPCSQSANLDGSYHDAIRFYANLGGQSTAATTYCNTHDVTISNFMTDVNAGKLPAFSFVVPNNNENMHNNSVASGDSWAKTFLVPFLDSAQYKSGDTALFFLWDEDTPIPNVLMAPSIRPGTQPLTPAGNPISHFSAIRTWQEMLGISPLLGDSGSAPSLLNFYNGK